MKNEAEFKKAFKQRVKAEGGFSLSLAGPMIVGLPDLYVILPGFMPVLLEAKWLGEVKEIFKRKIKYTAMQMHFMDEINGVKPLAAMGLVGYKIGRHVFATLVPRIYGAKEEFVTQDGITCAAPFGIEFLFNTNNVPKMNGLHKNEGPIDFGIKYNDVVHKI